MSSERYDALLAAVGNKNLTTYNKIRSYEALIALSYEAKDHIYKEYVDKALSLCTIYAKELKIKGSRPKERQELNEILGRLYTLKAQWDFHSYCMALEWNREPRKRFYQPRITQLRPIADELTRLALTDELDMLSLSFPPGTGKSTLGLVFMSWIVGLNPDKPNLVSGHSDKITKSFYDELYSLTTDPEYRFHDIFPDVELTTTSAKDESLDYRDDGKTIKRRYPTVTCRSIDGSLTGATRCEGIMYCDDLVASIEEAKNINRMNGLFDKYLSDLSSRKKKGAKELHIGTRWSIHDVIGRLEMLYEGNPRMKFIRIPALDENDESNFDYSYDVGFDTSYYHDLRMRYESREDTVSWECLYQQNPMEREGILFEKSNIKRFMSLPPEKPDHIFAYCDVAFGGKDYLAMPIAYQWGDDVYIADVVFLKGDYHVTEPVVANALRAHGVQNVIFEANNGGDFYSRDIDRRLKEKSVKCSIRTERASSRISKAGRIDQYAPDIRNFYFLDQAYYPSDGMYRNFVDNLTTYTVMGNNVNDDAPDALAGLASMLRKETVAVVRTFDRRSIGF